MYRFLLQPRWLGLAALVLVLCAAFVRLGFWQLDRYDERRARNAVTSANIDRDPVPAEALLSKTALAPRSVQWRPVRVSGQYDEGRTLLLRNQTRDGAKGFHVLVPLRTDDGAALLVDRGWIPAGPDARARVDVPPPPAGEVTLTGRVRISQEANARQARVSTETEQPSIGRIDLTQLRAYLPYPLLSGYVERVAEQPQPRSAPAALDRPELTSGPHLIYAVQWFLFCGIAVVGLVILARQERGLGTSRPDQQRAPVRTVPVPRG